MKTDYRDRSFASKNKPRRQPASGYVGIVTAVLFVFVSGFTGGWFTSRYMAKKAEPSQQAAVSPATTSVKTGQEPQSTTTPSVQPPQLFFYSSLQKVGRDAAMGSGRNTNLQEYPTTPAAKPNRKPQQVTMPTKPAVPAVPFLKSDTE